MSRIRRGKLRRSGGMIDDDVNPMEGAVNIVDAMLVFACGLMLSLVVYWNVDLRGGDMTPVSQGAEVSGAEALQEQIDGSAEYGSGFEEVGKVYRDPTTGKLYLAEDGGGQSTESGGQSTEADGQPTEAGGQPTEADGY
jgi:hypothetical protein